MRDRDKPVYVIGSGPAGVAAAHALVSQGIEVVMLDVGLDLEPERERLIDRMCANAPEAWEASDLVELKRGLHATADGIPQKLTYGSDFPFRDAGQAGAIEARGVDYLLSGAKGGLSNAWGSNIMPYTDRDISDWCISAADLAPHYAAVTTFIPVSAGRDDLEEDFPLYGANGGMLRPSRQAENLFGALCKHRKTLRADGVRGGYARLAVQVSATQENGRACVYCGLCLYGCPYRLIYSSRNGVRALEKRANFRYQPGIIVDSLMEEVGGVAIRGHTVESRELVRLVGSRVYLACGAIATTRILLESMQAYHHPVTLKDSLYFLLPTLQYDCVPGVTKEPSYSLGQVLLEVHDRALSERTIQLQYYTYTELFTEAVRSRLGAFFPLARPFLPALLGRLCIVMGYLHSDDSPSLSVQLRRQAGESKLVLEGIPSPRAKQVIRGVVKKLWRHRNRLRSIPLLPFLKVTKPGKSYHYGGTFPMKHSPGRFETDLLGRPAGFQRVHAVDASVLPSIAATTIVFTAMANAHRIASAYEQSELSSS
jgi:choline dehydrogenase-like flavoprotein